MMTTRQIERLWNAKSLNRLSAELLSGRQERAFQVEGLDRSVAVAALAMIRLDELSQGHVPLYGQLLRTLLQAQDSDGGFGDPAITALCLRALLLQQGQGSAIDSGLGYLAALQKEGGLWPAGPLRRMPEDPSTTLFILYELGEHPVFQSAVRFDDAVTWFDRHTAQLTAECRSLSRWASLRTRQTVSRRITLDGRNQPGAPMRKPGTSLFAV